MAFKSVKKELNEISPIAENELISDARGETMNVSDTKMVANIGESRKNKKPILVYVDISIKDRLKKFMTMEARRYESQNYILSEAIDKYLQSRGF